MTDQKRNSLYVSGLFVSIIQYDSYSAQFKSQFTGITPQYACSVCTAIYTNGYRQKWTVMIGCIVLIVSDFGVVTHWICGWTRPVNQIDNCSMASSTRRLELCVLNLGLELKWNIMKSDRLTSNKCIQSTWNNWHYIDGTHIHSHMRDTIHDKWLIHHLTRLDFA